MELLSSAAIAERRADSASPSPSPDKPAGSPAKKPSTALNIIRRSSSLNANLKSLLTHAGFKIDPAMVQKLKEVQEGYDKIFAELAAHGHGAAARAVERAQDALRANYTEENLQRVKQLSGSKVSLARRFRETRSVIRESLKEYSRTKIAPLISAVYLSLAEAIKEIADRHESEEREFAKVAGLDHEFTESEIAISVRKIAANFLRHAESITSGCIVISPRSALAGLPIDLGPAPEDVIHSRVNFNAGTTMADGREERRTQKEADEAAALQADKARAERRRRQAEQARPATEPRGIAMRRRPALSPEQELLQPKDAA